MGVWLSQWPWLAFQLPFGLWPVAIRSQNTKVTGPVMWRSICFSSVFTEQFPAFSRKVIDIPITVRITFIFIYYITPVVRTSKHNKKALPFQNYIDKITTVLQPTHPPLLLAPLFLFILPWMFRWNNMPFSCFSPHD